MRLKFVIGLLFIVVLFSTWSFFFLKGIFPENGEKITEFKKAYCELLGGQVLSAGCGISRCASTCKFGYRDAGKNCETSDDCSGKCVVTNPTIPQYIWGESVPGAISACKNLGKGFFDCKGLKLEAKCQKIEAANCETVWEYNKGMIKQLHVQCIAG